MLSWLCVAVLLDVEVIGESLLLRLVAAADVVTAALVGHQLPETRRYLGN